MVDVYHDVITANGLGVSIALAIAIAIAFYVAETSNKL